jgi:hypothetical protein
VPAGGRRVTALALSAAAAAVSAAVFTSWALDISVVEQWLLGALAFGAVIPLTLIVIMPTNRRLLAPEPLGD